jgi:hypothetical protein
MSAAPTFVATFADGEVTRMSVWHDPERRTTLDLRRGIKLARSAYITRQHNREHRVGFDGPPVVAPAIVEAHYEQDGVVLEVFDAKQIAERAS